MWLNLADFATVWLNSATASGTALTVTDTRSNV